MPKAVKNKTSGFQLGRPGYFLRRFLLLKVSRIVKNLILLVLSLLESKNS